MRIKLVLGFWLLGITLAWWAVAPSGAGLAPAAGAVGGGRCLVGSAPTNDLPQWPVERGP
jgi:hypothetical protein